MAVELAVLVPVILVAALSAFNLLRYVELCARFDRVALDAVVMQGVSPAGGQDAYALSSAVSQALRDAMGEADCEVTVAVEELSTESGSATLLLAAGTVRYTCTLGVRPWPSSVEVAGVGYRAPALLRHERSLVVDRYRAGVVR